ncbi:MAG: response regulator transcription factor [Sphingomonadales bacterium]|nr:response regulator transcription factor [Sphingomonadales bacterium]
MIRTILVDDEPLAIKGLQLRLDDVADVEVVATCRNGREALAAVKEHKPDLVFLDIQMPGMDGFAVAHALVGEHMPFIVFVTAYDEFAIKAFETHALDYLLKPVEDERMEDTLRRVRQQMKQQAALRQNARMISMLEEVEGLPKPLLDAVLAEQDAPKREEWPRQLNIKDRGVISRVDVSDILYLEAAGDYMCIHTGDKTHVLRATMKVMEKRLNPTMFKRIHRSTIVNLEKVKELHPHANGEYFLKLEDGSEVKVSRSYKAVVAQFR